MITPEGTLQPFAAQPGVPSLPSQEAKADSQGVQSPVNSAPEDEVDVSPELFADLENYKFPPQKECLP